MKPRYLVFLDFDGVLTSDRVHKGYMRHVDGNPTTFMWMHFDPVAVQFFNRLHDMYPLEFVWMTTWGKGLDMNDPMVAHIAEAMFRNAGFEGVFSHPNWKVVPDNDPFLLNKDRAYHVKDYLENHASFTVEDYLLFDDTRYDFDKVLGKKRFVQTDAQDGLLSKHMHHALALTGNWVKRK